MSQSYFPLAVTPMPSADFDPLELALLKGAFSERYFEGDGKVYLSDMAGLSDTVEMTAVELREHLAASPRISNTLRSQAQAFLDEAGDDEDIEFSIEDVRDSGYHWEQIIADAVARSATLKYVIMTYASFDTRLDDVSAGATLITKVGRRSKDLEQVIEELFAAAGIEP